MPCSISSQSFLSLLCEGNSENTDIKKTHFGVCPCLSPSRSPAQQCCSGRNQGHWHCLFAVLSIALNKKRTANRTAQYECISILGFGVQNTPSNSLWINTATSCAYPKHSKVLWQGCGFILSCPNLHLASSRAVAAFSPFAQIVPNCLQFAFPSPISKITPRLN